VLLGRQGDTVMYDLYLDVLFMAHVSMNSRRAPHSRRCGGKPT